MKTARKYRMKERAESQARTRMRIVEAAVGLHEQRGVKATTISEIAERAGVERLTVYRHFPDEISLVQACSGHWFERNPAPDPAAWRGVIGSAARTRIALASLYTYFRGAEAMLRSVLKDEPEVPAIKLVMKAFRGYLREMAEELVDAWNPEPDQRGSLAAAVSHSLQFHTWQSFKTQGLRDAETAELMVLWFETLSRAPRRRKARDGSGKPGTRHTGPRNRV